MRGQGSLTYTSAAGRDLIVYAQVTPMAGVLHHGSACDCSRCKSERKARGTQALAISIALRGGMVSKGQFVGKWVPYCDNPVHIYRMITSRQAVDNLHAMEVTAQVPCRRCAKCLQWRQMKWRERALSEVSMAKRTWFVTLTFSPIHLAGVLLEAKSGALEDVEPAAYRHVQKFFKRLRKLNKFRYLAIYERGDINGRSHYHLFLHEIGTRPIAKQQIENQWISFVHARLVGSNDADGAASYLTKYATKSFNVRPRASLGYGKHRVPIRVADGGTNS